MRKKLATDFFLLRHSALHENDRHKDTEVCVCMCVGGGGGGKDISETKQ